MGRKKTTGRIYKSKALSMEPKMLADVMARSGDLNMTFSEYVRRVLVQDLYERGEMVIRPKSQKK